MKDEEKTKEQLVAELAALRSAKGGLERLVESSLAVLYRCKPSGDYGATHVSANIREQMGYDPADFLNNSDFWLSHIHPEDRGRVIADFHHLLENDAQAHEYRFLHKDGSYRWMSDHLRVVRDNNGVPMELVGYWMDVTKQKEAEETVRNTLVFNQAILDTSPAGIVIFKASGEGVLANEAAARITGGSREQLATANYHAIASWKKCGLYDAACKTVNTGEVVKIETDIVTTYGRDIRITVTFSTFMLGNQTYLALLFSDVTDRRRAEEALRESRERYRSLFDDAAIPIWEEDFSQVKVFFDELSAAGVTDLRAYFEAHPDDVKKCASLVTVRDVNTASLLFSGTENREELMRDIAINFTDKSWPVFGEELIALAEGRSGFESEMPLCHRNGQHRDVIIKVSVPLSARKTLDKVMVSFIDITERKQMEQALKRSESYARAILENEPACIKIIGSDGLLRYMNPAGIAMLEAENLEAVQGRPLESFAVAEHLGAIRNLAEKVLKGEEGRLQFEVTGMKGTRRWLDTHVVPMRDEQGNVDALLGLTRDVTESRMIEDFQMFLAQSGGDIRQGDFFHSLAFFLATQLGIDFVCIDRLGEGSLTATTVAIYFDGRFEDNMTYTLQDTPCGEVVDKKICFIPSGVCEQFPHDKILQDMKAESYAGTILWGHQGEPIGLIALIWRKPMTNQGLIKSILQLVGVRAAGELERNQAEEAMRRSEELLTQSQEIAHLGSWELDLDRNILTWSDEAYRIFGFERGAVSPNYELFLSAVHPDDRVAVNNAYAGSLRENSEGYEIEHRVVLPDSGEIRVVHEKCKHIRNASGRITRSVGMTLDITDRRAIKEQLRESKQMLESVLDTIPVRVFWKDRNSVYLGCNRPFASDAGLSDPKEIIGKDDYAMGWREEADLYRADDRWVMESGIPKLNFEEPQTTPDGRLITLRTSKIPLLDSSGQVSGVLGTYEDITDRKQSEDALKDSEARYREIFEQTMDYILVLEPVEDGPPVIVDASESAFMRHGYSRDEMIGKPITFLDPDGAKAVTHEKDILRDGFSEFDVVHKCKDGSTFPARVISRKIVIKGRTLLYSVERDISDQKLTEIRLSVLSTAIEQGPASVVITDAAGNIEYVNPKFAELTGYSLQEAIGQNPRILKSDVQSPEVYEHLWQVITAGNTWRGEFCNKKKNGELYWEKVVISPVKDDTGVITHFLAVKEDITEIKKVEEARKGLEAQLRQAQKLETIGTLAGGIAHDFNNILQPVNSCTEILRSRLPADSPMLKYVDLMSRSVERGSGLVKQLLTFSRQRESERKPTRIQPVVEETLNLLRALMPATVEIHSQVDPACAPVLADPVQIQQVLMNLCVNACDAMDKRGLLGVRLDAVDMDEAAARGGLRLQPGRYARITVRDTGHGMDDETQKRIFDPFFTTKEVGKGTGLGLSVVHGIVQEYGGEILVESEPRKGTTFSVYLPCTDIAVGEKTESRQDEAIGGNGSVLFVDDNEDIVFVAEDMMEHLGYTITATTRYEDALELFRRNPSAFDLVVSDYSMPGMNGVQFAWEILKVRPDVPILLITGNNDAIPPEKLKEVPIRGVLSKPFKMEEIGEAMKKVME